MALQKMVQQQLGEHGTNQESGSFIRDSFQIRLFDETDMISEEHKAIMNERLLEMQTRFQIQAVKI
jgi:hypothetical protein